MGWDGATGGGTVSVGALGLLGAEHRQFQLRRPPGKLTGSLQVSLVLSSSPTSPHLPSNYLEVPLYSSASLTIL